MVIYSKDHVAASTTQNSLEVAILRARGSQFCRKEAVVTVVSVLCGSPAMTFLLFPTPPSLSWELSVDFVLCDSYVTSLDVGLPMPRFAFVARSRRQHTTTLLTRIESAVEVCEWN
jgi:hypothetical protein